MLKIGVTGGIGSGKTTVCKLFELLGIPVYYADERAKWLMQHDAILTKNLSREFGSDIFNDGTLQTKVLAAKVFNTAEQVKKLNALVHPAVHDDFEKWVKQQTDTPFTIEEAALIFEAGSDKRLDKVITVLAAEELRINRIMKRDNVSMETVVSRIKHQLPEEEKTKRSQYVIYNDDTQLVIPQVLQIYNALKK